MATFEARINGLTGLTIGTSPTVAQVSEYLNDGVMEVTNRVVALKPNEIGDYTRVTSELTSNGHNLGSATIIAVVRETGTVNDWRPAREVSAGLQTRVTDETSLHYASKYNPAFIKWNDSSIVVYPAPTTSPNRYKIFYVNNVPTYTGGSSGAYDSTGISYFPKDKVYLVILYAGIRALTKALADINISAFSVSSVPPATIPVPSISSPGVSSTLVSLSGDVPTYEVSTSVPDFASADDLINTEEDPELASVRVQAISQQIQKYSSDISNQVNKFNKENAIYSGEIQKSLKQADIDLQKAVKEGDLTLQASLNDYTLELQKYGAEIQKYQMDVQKEVAEHKEEVLEKTNEYQWMALRMQNLIQEYSTAFGIQAPKQQAPQEQQDRKRQRRSR